MGRLVRLGQGDQPRVAVNVDGAPIEARAGESVLAAVLTARSALGTRDFESLPRAGFCLMGACQDCWIWTEDGTRLQACLTPVSEGMRLLSGPPAGWPGSL